MALKSLLLVIKIPVNRMQKKLIQIIKDAMDAMTKTGINMKLDLKLSFEFEP